MEDENEFYKGVTNELETWIFFLDWIGIKNGNSDSESVIFPLSTASKAANVQGCDIFERRKKRLINKGETERERAAAAAGKKLPLFTEQMFTLIVL